MSTTQPTTVRRLVLIRPVKPAASGVRRLMLARRNDALLPASHGAVARRQGVRAP